MASKDDLTARVMYWAQTIKATGDPIDVEIAGLLAAMELRKRKGERKSRRKQAPNAAIVDRLTGRAIAGSTFYFEERGRQ